jgi:hypothetical protein
MRGHRNLKPCIAFTSQRFLTVFNQRARYLSHSWARIIQFTFFHPIYFIFIFFKFSYLILSTINGVILQVLPPNVYTDFTSLPFVLHAQPTSSSLETNGALRASDKNSFQFLSTCLSLKHKTLIKNSDGKSRKILSAQNNGHIMRDFTYSYTIKTTKCVKLQFLTHARQWMSLSSLKIVGVSCGNNMGGSSLPHVAVAICPVFTVTYSHVTLIELWMSRRNDITPAFYPGETGFWFRPRDRLSRLNVVLFFFSPSRSTEE